MSTPFMQLYVADYLGDTTHLTTEQHGAYLLLLMTMWRAGGVLPNDDGKLARIVRLTPARWRTVRPEVIGFFEIDNERITQKRLVAEYEKAQEKSVKRADAGRAGGAAKALKNNEPALANASDLLKHSSEPELEPEEVSSLRSDATADISPPPNPKLSRKRTTTPMPPNFPDDRMRLWALEHWRDRQRRDLCEDYDEIAQRFRDHHAKDDVRFSDWSAAWRNWVRNEVKFNKGNQNGGNHTTGRGKPPNQSFATTVSERVAARARGSLFGDGGPEGFSPDDGGGPILDLRPS